MIKSTLPLSLIIALRFLGLFIVLPVLSVYALSLEGANTFLVGVIMGGYALTQTIFQVPFGVMSDKIGRKRTLFIGLMIFAAGSIVCALSSDIYTLMFGRFLQGAGAIGSVVTAMISDMVKEEVRAHAMAIMGGTIAMSFAISMIAGPVIGAHYGVDKLFWITALLAVLATLILFTSVPNPPKIIHSYSEEESKMIHVFKDESLVRMFVTFLFHTSIMTMAFLIIPIVMTKTFGWDRKELWMVYLPAMVLGLISMAPAAILGEKKNKGKEVFLVSVCAIAAGFALMGFSTNPTVFIIGVALFFIGFNMFEPLLQSFVSKFAKVHQKGAALGVANSFAYFGAFLGGITGGYFMHCFDRSILALFVIALCVFWFSWILKMKNPSNRTNVYLPLEKYNRSKLDQIKNLIGVIESYINESEKLIIIKYEKELTNEEKIREFMKNFVD